jgi:hypothetical protein
MLTYSNPGETMGKQLILPAEIKVCATCSYWDGKRKIDPELRVVVVDDSCEGQCLVQDKCCQGLNDEFEWRDDCLWEHLAPDEEPQVEEKKP